MSISKTYTRLQLRRSKQPLLELESVALLHANTLCQKDFIQLFLLRSMDQNYWSLESYKHQDQCVNSQIFLVHLQSLKNFRANIKFWIMFNLMLAIFTCLSTLSSMPKSLELNLKAILMKRCGHGSYGMAMSCSLALKGNERL